MTRALLFLFALWLSTGAVFAADCTPSPESMMPNIAGRPYAEARSSLISAGWQPYLNLDTIETPVDEAEGLSIAWAIDAGFFEIQACSGTGTAPCRSNFIDQHRTWLRVITESGPSDDHTVSSTYYVCGPDE